MNVIYETVSDSILKYLKKQGQSSDSEYYIIRIRYYNILGTLDSLDILKMIKSGDKIVSTRPKSSKKSSSPISKSKSQKSKKSKINNEIDYTTIHSKLGLITPTAWNKLQAAYSKLLRSKMEIMEHYCKSYISITNSVPFFAYNGVANMPQSSSPKTLSKNEFPNEGFVLHGGCDYIKKQLDKFASSSNKKGIKIATPFTNVYQIFPNSKTLLRIHDCKSFDAFMTKYSNSTSTINWKKVMADYEGILVENINCTTETKHPPYKKILLDVLNKKISRNKLKNIKMQLASNNMRNMGYIWKLNKSKFVKVI